MKDSRRLWVFIIFYVIHIALPYASTISTDYTQVNLPMLMKLAVRTTHRNLRNSEAKQLLEFSSYVLSTKVCTLEWDNF